MRKRVLLLLTTMIIFGKIHSQVTEVENKLREQKNDSLEGWKKSGMFSFALSQVSLSNWAAGGENSLSGNTMFNIFAGYKKKKISFDNNLDLGYGIMKQGEQNIRKTDDKIDFTSKLGRKLSNKAYMAALFNFKTQFMPGYNYPNDSVVISKFLAPAYILFAFGYDYKESDWLSLFFAPITGKLTIVNDQVLANAGAFGVEPIKYDPNDTTIILSYGKKSRLEFGGYFKGMLRKDITKNVRLNTKLELFSNYVNKPQNIDVHWENNINMKVNKYISLILSTTLIYDDDIKIEVKDNSGNVVNKAPRTQFKEVFGLGLSYKF